MEQPGKPEATSPEHESSPPLPPAPGEASPGARRGAMGALPASRLLGCLLLLSFLSAAPADRPDFAEPRDRAARIKVNPRGNLWATGTVRCPTRAPLPARPGASRRGAPGKPPAAWAIEGAFPDPGGVGRSSPGVPGADGPAPLPAAGRPPGKTTPSPSPGERGAGPGGVEGVSGHPEPAGRDRGELVCGEPRAGVAGQAMRESLGRGQVSSPAPAGDPHGSSPGAGRDRGLELPRNKAGLGGKSG